MAEYYKTATLTGAAPSGHPVALQVWNYEPDITGLGTSSVLATDVGAMQGVAASTSYFFTSSGTSASPSNNRIIRTYSSAWSLLFSKDTALDLASHTQVNGLFYDAAASKLYAGANNHNTIPAAGWVLEYDVETDGSLTFVASHSVGAIWCEGCAKYDGSFWVIAHDSNQIHQFDTSWTLVQSHTLPGATWLDGGVNGPQGILFVGDVAVLNLHGSNPLSPYAPNYRWTGTAFVAEFAAFVPPTDCTQGLHLSANGANILWARRNLNSSTSAADVVSTPIANSYEGVGLEGRNLADFSDVRITTADGATVLAGGGAGWREHYLSGKSAWFHFALPAAIVTSTDFRVYYGDQTATWSEAGSAGVVLKINDFEAGRDDFTNNYNTGSAASSAGNGLLGTASISVSSPGTGDGVYSDDLDFMAQGLRKLTGWVKPQSGQAGAAPGVYFMQTTTGTTRRRGAIVLNNTNAQAVSSAVTQTAFATGFVADTWRRFEVKFDYTNSKFGVKMWDDQGILRGATAKDAYNTDNGTRTYKDVLLFKAMHADRIFSQSLLSTEPAWGTWSAETAAATTHSGAAALSGSGTATVVGTRTTIGAAALSGSGNVTALAARMVTGSASLSASGSLVAAAKVTLLGATSLSGTGTLTAAGVLGGQLIGAAALAGSGTLTAAASVLRGATAPLAGSGTLAASATVSRSGAALLAGTGTLAVLGRLEANAAAALVATGTLTAVGRTEAPRFATAGARTYESGPSRPAARQYSTRPRAVSTGRR